MMHNPAHYARELLSEFQACAQKDGVDVAAIELHHANFLEEPAVKKAMSSAGLVYINNPRFGPELNGKILRNNTPCHTIDREILLIDFEQDHSVPTCPRAAN
jgi:hypothetical protein